MTERPETKDQGLSGQAHAGTGAPEGSEPAPKTQDPETKHIEDEGEPLGANFA
jgi:hypothetical protein